MPIALDTAITRKDVRLDWVSDAGDTGRQVLTVGGSMTSAQIEDLLDAVDAISNAGMASIAVHSSVDGFGQETAVGNSQNLLSARMFLTFERVHPLNAAKTITKTIAVPAFLDSLRDTDNKPVTGDTDLNAYINLLEDFLLYEAVDGSLTTGGWLYNRNKSGFGTVPDEIGF